MNEINEKNKILSKKTGRVCAKSVVVKVFVQVLPGSDPQLAPDLPADTFLIPRIVQSVNSWSEGKAEKVWAVDYKEIVDDMPRKVKVCLIVFEAKITKDPDDRSWICKDVHCQLGFVETSYPGQSPWNGFETQFGKAAYWIFEREKWTHKPEGHKGTIDKLVQAKTLNEKLGILTENYGEKQALMFANKMLGNAKTFEKASVGAQQQERGQVNPQGCTAHCKYHEDEWQVEKRVMQQNIDKLTTDLARLEAAQNQKDRKQELMDLVSECFVELMSDGILLSVKRMKVDDRDQKGQESSLALMKEAQRVQPPSKGNVRRYYPLDADDDDQLF